MRDAWATWVNHVPTDNKCRRRTTTFQQRDVGSVDGDQSQWLYVRKFMWLPCIDTTFARRLFTSKRKWNALEKLGQRLQKKGKRRPIHPKLPQSRREPSLGSLLTCEHSFLWQCLLIGKQTEKKHVYTQFSNELVHNKLFSTIGMNWNGMWLVRVFSITLNQTLRWRSISLIDNLFPLWKF